MAPLLKCTTAALLLALLLPLTGCSSFSKSARQQRAYEKYVRKSSLARTKQQSRFLSSRKPRIPKQPEPSDPVESTSTGPESMSSDAPSE